MHISFCFVDIFLFQRWIYLKYDAVYVVTVMWGRTSLIFIAGISHEMSWDIFRQISRFWSWQWVVGVFAKVNLTLLWLIPVVLWIYGPPRHSQDTNRLKYSTQIHISSNLHSNMIFYFKKSNFECFTILIVKCLNLQHLLFGRLWILIKWE